MTQKWNVLQAELRSGVLSRRQFIAAAAALGITGNLVDTALAQTPKRGGHLVLGIDSAQTSDSLDPARFNADYMDAVGNQLYDQLTEIDEHVKVKPSLAESWDARPGAKEWIFKLRKGVHFHNGKEMTAADVVFSLNHHRGKDSKSGAKAIFAPVSDIKATSKYEVTFTLDSGSADMPYLLSDIHLAIGPEDSAFNDGVGTGAFVLESFEPGVRTLAKRNPNDWRRDRGYVATVETIAINDPTARISALLSGSVHLICKIAPNSVAQLAKDPKVQTFNVSGGGHVIICMPCDAPPFDNLDLRLAMKYAIDRQAILDKILRGYGRIGNDQPIPNFDPMYAADIPQRPYDLDKAKFHYKKSGHSGPLVLNVSESPMPGAVDMTQIFQAGAVKAGIDLQINHAPNDGYYEKYEYKTFMVTYFGGRPTADFMLSVAYASKAPWNVARWYRPKFDELLTAARGELNPAKRKQMYHDLQLMVHDDGGAIIPIFTNFIDAAQKKVHGFVPTPTHLMSEYRAPEKVWLET